MVSRLRIGGKRLNPHACVHGIAKHYSQHQLYPMIIELYEKV